MAVGFRRILRDILWVLLSKMVTIRHSFSYFQILDLLSDLNISYDVNDSIEKKLDDMLKSKINYDEINLILLELRNKSIKYILNQLERGNM